MLPQAKNAQVKVLTWEMRRVETRCGALLTRRAAKRCVGRAAHQHQQQRKQRANRHAPIVEAARQQIHQRQRNHRRRNLEQERASSFKLDFLTPGKRYKAEIYRDGDDADYRTDKRHSIVIESKVVTSQDAMNLRIAPGGGFAIRLVPVK